MENQVVNIFSEISPLRRVMVKAPSAGLGKVTPDNFDNMLVDDVIDVDEAKREHAEYVRFLKTQGIQVVNREDLLRDVLRDKELRRKILVDVFQDINEKSLNILDQCSAEEVATYLELGVAPVRTGLGTVYTTPNDTFTRDPSIMVGLNFLSGRAARGVREREFILTSAIFSHHPTYAHVEHIPYDRTIGTLEGGDVQVLRKDIVCIGVSERTSIEAVESLYPALHELGFENVLAVELPKRRSSMHLDTVFTMVSETECVVYDPFILGNDKREACKVKVYKKVGDNVNISEKENLLVALEELYGHALTTISCGGGDVIDQEREQWTDGANCLAIAPGHALVYKRNRKTIREFEKHGYIYVPSEKVNMPLDHNKKFIIGLEGFELSRARGGSHCLSFPIVRD